MKDDNKVNNGISEVVEQLYQYKYKIALATSEERLAKIKAEREFADKVMLQYIFL